MDRIESRTDPEQSSQEVWDAKYPQHAKLRTVKHDSQAIGAFLDWLLHERGDTHICTWPEGDNHPGTDPTATIEGLLGEYFGIDPKALSREKDAMYDELTQFRGDKA